MGHNKNCKCEICLYGREAYEKKIARFLKDPGWYAEYLDDACGCPFHINAHTHGIQENFNHPDFQICLPVPMDFVNDRFHTLVHEIKAGRKFEAGVKYHDLVEDYPLWFVNAIEGNRPVLRMIIPPPHTASASEKARYLMQETMTGIEALR